MAKFLSTCQTELELARKNAELADLQQEKEDIEDDKHCLEMEMSADRERLQDVMKQLADSHSAVKSMEKSLKAHPGDTPVSEDDKDREIQMLKSEVHMAQIEIKGHRQSAKKSRKMLADIEKQRQTLERRLVRSNQERDSLANGILKVEVESRTLKSRQISVGTEHEAAIEIAESLTKAIENKDSEATYLRQEKMELEEKLKQSDNKLQIIQIQAQQYVEDIKQERCDRENAFSIKDGKFQVQVQVLRDELKSSQEIARNERREKQEVIANLEVAIKERQQKQSQLAQAHNDFELFLQLKDKEFKQLAEKKQKLSLKYENQLKQVGIQNMQLQTDLKKKIDQLQATLREQIEQAETVTAEKLSLEEQHEKTTREFKLKEEQLEIAANEKAAISNEIAAWKNEIAQAKTTSGRMGVELQAARERLEVAIADTAKLHDEVMAKTAQVKQYKKQTDSFKAKAEEIKQEKMIMEQDYKIRLGELNSRHQHSRRDLYQRLKTMEEEKQVLVYQQQHTLSDQDSDLALKTNHQIRNAVKTIEQLIKRHHPQKRLLPAPEIRNTDDAIAPHLLTLEIPLDFSRKVGQGSYGAVYAVNYGRTSCIAKRLWDIFLGRGGYEPVNDQGKKFYHQKFIHECVLLSRTNHSNIVRFIGVHRGKDEFDLTLLMERLHTDLGQYLESKPIIAYKTEVSILNNVSCGLLYLHEECSIIHRDLTAANILLTADNRAKIADLGMSRIFDIRMQKMSKVPGNQYYMSPEALQDKPYDKRLDIFSFGVIALYVATQDFPEPSYDHVPDAVHARGECELFKRQKLIKRMEERRPELSFLILWCLSDNPMMRPSTFCVNILLQAMTIDL